MELTGSSASSWGRMGAHLMHSKHDARETTAAARRGFLQRFERQVDPDGTLSEAERKRRAEHALHAHMQQLASRSAIARSKRKTQPSAQLIPACPWCMAEKGERWKPGTTGRLCEAHKRALADQGEEV